MVSELHNPRGYAFENSGVSSNLQDHRIAGFETIQHALKISQRGYGHSIQARDHVAFAESLRSVWQPDFRRQSIWIHILDVKTANSG